MSAIRLEGVSKAYPRYQHFTRGLKQTLFHLPEVLRTLRAQQFLALQDVSVDIDHGETVGVVGANGSGKSTLLGLIAGVLQPQAGTVDVQGRIAPLLELGAGFHPELTGRENIVLNGVLLGLRRAEVVSRLEAIIEFSEMRASLDQPLRTYSSGMVARLGFAVAAHLDPDVLLIDEILAVGDEHFQAKCREKIADFRERGVTIVLVSHALGDILRLCHRVIWLERGRIRASGDPASIIEAYVAASLDPGHR
ncbi:MAG TPA: ABC transporter ATP-binding protein [Candidatus Binatia bacterium]|nr:ABC transporter ATP-binding protein [Candidatus Binatia bacterium]